MKEKKTLKTPRVGWTVASAENALRHATKGQMSRRECGAADYLRLIAKGRTRQAKAA